MNFNDLSKEIIKKKSPVVVGLDPRVKRIPDEFKQNRSLYETLYDFNKEIIDSVYDLVPAVKLQIAFYEKYGLAGLKAYVDSKNYAKTKGLFVIGDVKRGDIGSTSLAYANGHLGKVDYANEQVNDFEVDNITINPYLGEDCLKEFVEDIKAFNKSVFVLVKTSNPSSAQLQDLESDHEKIYIKVAQLVNRMNQDFDDAFAPFGAVVGATYPEELMELRRVMPNTYFLVPGYGAQGGGAEDVMNAFNEEGLGAIVNSSRGIIFAYEKNGLSIGKGAREAVIEMKNSINTALENANKVYWE